MEFDLSNWMAKLPSKLQEMPLQHLSIPGSHDSGGFYLDKNSGIAPDEGKTVRNLAKLFGSCAKNIIYNWSVTQELCFYDQLMQGVRYFDLRVAYDEATKNFCFVHGLYGLPYSTIFKEFKEFLLKHPKEVLILDFNHLWDFTTDQCIEFMKIIEENFSGMFFGPGTKGTKYSLKDLWNSNKQIIAFYEDDASAKENPLFWERNKIFSPWFNTDNADNLIDDLDKRFDSLKEDCFNVFQAILTPQTSTVFLHLTGSLKGTLAGMCDKRVCSWLQKIEKEKKNGVNIVICDFIENEGLPSKVIALNYIHDAKELKNDCLCDQGYHFESQNFIMLDV